MSEKNKQIQAVVGNPPYQNAVESPIFHDFQRVSGEIGKRTALIYPGRWLFWVSGDRGKFREEIMSSGLKKVQFWDVEEVRKKIFPEVDINGGITIVEYAKGSQGRILFESNGEKTEFLPSDKLFPILPKLRGITEKLQSLGHRTLLQSEDLTYNEIGIPTKDILKASPEITDAKTPVPAGKVKFYGNLSGSKGGKSRYFLLDSKKLQKIANISIHEELFTVAMRQSILENQNRDLIFTIFPKGVILGRSSIVLKRFKTIKEAENFRDFLKVPIIEELFKASLGGRMKTLGAFVPDLIDYSEDNPLFAEDKDLKEGHIYRGLSLSERVCILIEFSP